MKENVIAVFDTGKTNKKILLFNESYEIVYEKGLRFPEITDEDGDPCDDIEALEHWVLGTVRKFADSKVYNLVAVNFGTHGASFVHLDKSLRRVGPLYNYLKELPHEVLQQFLQEHDTQHQLSIETESPLLGAMLNSGLQLYWLKCRKPELFASIQKSIHFEHYFSYLLTGKLVGNHTAVGCHTMLWDHQVGKYHRWVDDEGLLPLFPEMVSSQHTQTVHINGKDIQVGVGIHDSSAAIIPFLRLEKDFLLVSTGTWSICMNPYNDTSLTDDLLERDVLTYTSFTGSRILSSRLFLGHEHDMVEALLAKHFGKPPKYHRSVKYNPMIIHELLRRADENLNFYPQHMYGTGPFPKVKDRPLPDLWKFDHYEEAYHQLILDLIYLQKASIDLVKSSQVKKLLVTGGFTLNDVYMNLLAETFPEYAVFSSEIRRATALGTAMLLHDQWNEMIMPDNLLKYNRYTPSKVIDLSTYDLMLDSRIA